MKERERARTRARACERDETGGAKREIILDYYQHYKVQIVQKL